MGIKIHSKTIAKIFFLERGFLARLARLPDLVVGGTTGGVAAGGGSCSRLKGLARVEPNEAAVGRGAAWALARAVAAEPTAAAVRSLDRRGVTLSWYAPRGR